MSIKERSFRRNVIQGFVCLRELSVGEMPIGEKSVREMPVGELSGYQIKIEMSMASFCIESLLTNIPLQEAIDLCVAKFIQRQD